MGGGECISPERSEHCEAMSLEGCGELWVVGAEGLCREEEVVEVGFDEPVADLLPEVAF